jgi:uronate dehydrogenase
VSERILITGAAGAIGTLLRAELRRPGRELVLLDVAAPPPAQPGEPVEIVTASVDDLDAVLAAATGTDAIIHLGSLITDRRWEEYARVNITGTYVVLEAARRAGVPRVVYASSNHAVGFLERPRAAGPPVPADHSPRPDSLYGVGKVASEALGSLYHDRHGLDVVCARIGSCRPVPDDRRCLWSWLSYPDAVRLMEAALSVPHPGFRIVWGVSANTRGWWSLAEGRAIGYLPQDDAEVYAEAILAAPAGGPDAADPRHLGGPYTAPGFDAAGRT